MDSIIFRMFADTPKCWEYIDQTAESARFADTPKCGEYIVVNVSGQLFGLQYLN